MLKCKNAWASKTKWIGLVGLMTILNLKAADDESDAIRAEIRAMRQAYESRIAALESEVKGLKSGTGFQKREAERKVDEVLNKSEAPMLASNSPLHSVQGTTKLTLGGYTEFKYIDRGDSISEFDQHRTIAQLGARIQDRLQLYLEIEYEHGAVIEGGEETGSELELEQAWIDYEINKALNFRAGMVLVPVGRYNLYHEGHVNNFVDRPLVDRRIIGTTWFEEGLGFHGRPLDTESLGISYEAYVFNPARATDASDEKGFRGIRNEGRSPTSDKKAGAARVAFEPARKAPWLADYLELGISGYISGFDGFKGEDELGNDLNLQDGNIQLAALDATYEKWNFGFKSEFAFAHADSGANATQRKQDAWGYYVEGFYKFWPGFLNASPFGNGFKKPQLVIAARYDWVDLNLDRFDQRDMGRVTLGISYRPLPNTVFKFDYQIDHSPSGRAGTTLDESGNGKNTDAFLFSVATGF